VEVIVSKREILTLSCSADVCTHLISWCCTFRCCFIYYLTLHVFTKW